MDTSIYHLLVSTSSPQLDMQGSDSQSSALLSNILGSQHSGVGRGLITISLHLHASCDTADCFPAMQKLVLSHDKQCNNANT